MTGQEITAIATLLRSGQLERAQALCLESFVRYLPPPHNTPNQVRLDEIQQLAAGLDRKIAMAYARQLMWIAGGFAKAGLWDEARQSAWLACQIFVPTHGTQADLCLKLLLLAGQPTRTDCEIARAMVQAGVISTLEKDMDWAAAEAGAPGISMSGDTANLFSTPARQPAATAQGAAQSEPGRLSHELDLVRRFRQVPLGLILIEGGATLLLALTSVLVNIAWEQMRRGLLLGSILSTLLGVALFVVGCICVAGKWPGPRLSKLPEGVSAETRAKIESLYRPARAWIVAYGVLGAVIAGLLLIPGLQGATRYRGIPILQALQCLLVGLLPSRLGLRVRGWIPIALGGITIAAVLPLANSYLGNALVLLCGVVSIVEALRYRSVVAEPAAL